MCRLGEPHMWAFWVWQRRRKRFYGNYMQQTQSTGGFDLKPPECKWKTVDPLLIHVARVGAKYASAALCFQTFSLGKLSPRGKLEGNSSLLHAATWFFMLFHGLARESSVLMTAKESQNSRHRTQLSNNLTVLRATEEVRRGSFRLAIFWKAWNVVIEFAIKWCERRKINQVEGKSKSKQRKLWIRLEFQTRLWIIVWDLRRRKRNVQEFPN